MRPWGCCCYSRWLKSTSADRGQKPWQELSFLRPGLGASRSLHGHLARCDRGHGVDEGSRGPRASRKEFCGPPAELRCLRVPHGPHCLAEVAAEPAGCLREPGPIPGQPGHPQHRQCHLYCRHRVLRSKARLLHARHQVGGHAGKRLAWRCRCAYASLAAISNRSSTSRPRCTSRAWASRASQSTPPRLS